MGCSFRSPFVGTKAPSLHTLLFQLQAVVERLAHTLCDFIIAVGVGVKCDGVDLRHINFSIHHNAFIGSDIDHLTDDAASVFIVLILDEPALQADRKLVDESGSTVSALLAVRPLRANLSATLLPDSTPK